MVGDVPGFLNRIIHDDGIPAQIGALLDGHRTREVVPKRRKADTSNMLPSPPMTWRRRNCAGLAWGSSRVLMIGRLKVVSRPTSFSTKSARWDIWKPGTSLFCPRPTRPAPQITGRVTMNGVRPRMIVSRSVMRGIW